MKQRTSKILYDYWNEARADRLAPRRLDIEPARITEILAETFILERGDSQTYGFRLAGTRVCDHLGVELRGRNLCDLVADADRPALEKLLATVTGQGAVALLEVEARDSTGRIVGFEMTVMPLVHVGQTINRYLGALSAIDPPVWLGHEVLGRLSIVHHTVIWPEGQPHAVVARKNRQAPFHPELANARVVRFDRRQFRILDGGQADAPPPKPQD